MSLRLTASANGGEYPSGARQKLNKTNRWLVLFSLVGEEGISS
jgi:hypothetical protein